MDRHQDVVLQERVRPRPVERHRAHGEKRLRGPGQDEAFNTVMKAYATAYTTAGVNAPWVTYQSVAGGAGPTFYLIMPIESYAAIDADLSSMAAVGAKMPSAAAVAAQLTASVERMETQVLTLSPQISYVPTDFSNQDKAFWQAK